MSVFKKWLKVIGGRTLWKVLSGFLSGVVVGVVILVLGLILLAPEPNEPPPQQENSPGDVTIQLSQSYLSAVAAQNLNGTGIPTPLGSLPLENARAQPQSGDQLTVTGDVVFPVTGARQVQVLLHPCVASTGRPALKVTRVLLGDQPITSFVESSIQQKIDDALKNVNPSIPHEHLVRMRTTPDALLLIYSSGSGTGQPAC